MGFFFEMLFSAYVIVSCNVKCDYLLLVPLSTNSLSMHNYYFFFCFFMSLVKYVGSIVFLNFMSMNYLNLIDWFILFIVCKSSSYLENKSQHAIIL